MTDTSPSPGDMDPEEFRRHGYAIIDRIAEFMRNPERFPVLPAVRPGETAALLPTSAPQHGEPMERVLADFDEIIVPRTTQWNHPGFLAYFSTSASSPGVLAETLTAALNANAMLWRTGPAATELEQVTLGWLRDLMGLARDFEGTINDTASSSTLYALAAARELHTDLHIREHGLAGRAELPRLRIYCSADAHSSVDKAVITLGLGRTGLRHIPTDANYAMDADALANAVADDVASGIRPIAVVATVGTTSTTAVDPVARIADVCERHDMWLHVDASYAGAAAIIPEMQWVMDGCNRVHSLVVNPHKWLFVPMDCSILYTRRPDVLRRAFSLVPEYLTTTDPSDVRNLMDYGVSLGRRFRALKLWFVLRYFGADGIRDRLRHHIALAQEFAKRIDDAPDFERVAPAPFSVVVFRYRPDPSIAEDELERLNAHILDTVNRSGDVFLSHTKVAGRYCLRLAIGNIRTDRVHIDRAWQLIERAAADAPL